MIWAIKEVSLRLNKDGTTGTRGREELQTFLAAGWEPYAVCPSTPWTMVHYLKRSQP